MSIEIRAKIICDTCGAFVEGAVETSSTGGMRTYWRAKDEAKKQHWLTLPRYGKHTHLFQACADGVPATVVADSQ